MHVGVSPCSRVMHVGVYKVHVKCHVQQSHVHRGMCEVHTIAECDVCGWTDGKADSPRNFEVAIWRFFKDNGFSQDPHEKSLWVRGVGTKHVVMVVNFCDDIISAANCDEAHAEYEKELTARWGDCSVGLPSYILGCDVVQTESTFRLTAASKIDMILVENRLTGCKPNPTPFPAGSIVDVRSCRKEKPKVKDTFRRVIGQLQYIQCSCRPTISYNVSQLSRVQAQPGEEHWKLLRHILKYLAGTRDAGVEFRRQPPSTRNCLAAYSDASWADIPGGIGHPLVTDGRKSSLGRALFVNGGPVSWKSHVSQIVALSSAEAELFATVECGKVICDIRRMLEHLGEPQAPTPTTLWCDSPSVCSINSKRNTSSKLRHLEIKWFHVRYLAESGIIETKKIPGEHNPADLFTKALGEAKFRYFAEMLEQGQSWNSALAAALHMDMDSLRGWSSSCASSYSF